MGKMSETRWGGIRGNDADGFGSFDSTGRGRGGMCGNGSLFVLSECAYVGTIGEGSSWLCLFFRGQKYRLGCRCVQRPAREP